VLEASRKHATGDPENPVTPAELTAKAKMLLTGGGMAEADAGRLIAAVLDLVHDRPVRDLGLFRPALREAASRSVRSA
jgi:hypothetical protein